MFTLTAAGGWFPGSGGDKVRAAAAHGFGAVELLCWKDLDLAETRRAIDETGTVISAILIQSRDPEKQKWIDNTRGIVHEQARAAYLDAMAETVEAARVLGVKNIVVTTGNERAGVPRAVQHANVVQALRASVPMLEAAGMTAVLEPLNILVDHRGYFLTATAEAAAIIDEVQSPAVRVLYDVYHQQITEGNLISTIRQYIDRIGHIHVGDVPGRKEPGTGEINYRNVFRAIRDTGYTGVVVFECGLSEDADTVCRKMWALLD